MRPSQWPGACRVGLLICLAWMFAPSLPPAYGQQAEPAPDKQSRASNHSALHVPLVIHLKDGSVLKGRIVEEDGNILTVLTLSGAQVTVPRSAVASIGPLGESAGQIRLSDPNYSRLMFAPTGRPLREGEGYVFDYWVFFPGVAYGVSDRLTLMAGISVVPGLDLGQQIKYVAPKFGADMGRYALSGGVLVISVVEEFFAGIAFGVGTLGGPDKSATAGLGFGFVKVEDEELRFGEHPVLTLGGNVRVSNSAALVSENWFILGGGLTMAQQPFALAVRFFGERVAVDAGFILVGEILKEGFPVPWLSFVYNFGA